MGFPDSGVVGSGESSRSGRAEIRGRLYGAFSFPLTRYSVIALLVANNAAAMLPYGPTKSVHGAEWEL